jgi:hypothetical protein
MPREFKAQVRIICPFCGGLADLGDDGVVHMLPTCKAFDEMDVEDYVHAVHEFIQKTAKPENKPS